MSSNTKADEARILADHLETVPAAPFSEREVTLAESARVLRGFASDLDARDRECEELRGALAELVKANEEWNAAVEKVIGRPPTWTDGYLDRARAALRRT